MGLRDGRVCDPSERHQPTAPAEGGEGKGGEWGQLAQLLRPFRADPTLLPTWSIYNILTLQLKYTYTRHWLSLVTIGIET